MNGPSQKYLACSVAFPLEYEVLQADEESCLSVKVDHAATASGAAVPTNIDIVRALLGRLRPVLIL